MASALYRDQITGIAHLLAEIQISQGVLHSLSQGDSPSEKKEAIRSAGLKRANSFLDGRLGFNQLGIALACNGQGHFGIGAPPNIWHSLRHLPNNPKGWLKMEGLGLLLSEAQSIIGIGLWLSHATGRGFLACSKALLQCQIHTARRLLKTAQESELRATTFGSGRHLNSRLVNILAKLENATSPAQVVKEIQQAIRAIPPTGIQFSMLNWWRDKLHVLEKLRETLPRACRDIEDIPALSRTEIFSNQPQKDGHFLQSLLKAVASNDTTIIMKHLEYYQDAVQSRHIRVLAYILSEIGFHGQNFEEALIDDHGLTAEVHRAEKRALLGGGSGEVGSLERELRHLRTAVAQLSSGMERDELRKVALKTIQDGFDPRQLLQELGYLKRSTLREAADRIVDIRTPREDLAHSVKEEPESIPNQVPRPTGDLREWILKAWE
ncbi:MAG: hypothetical protein KDD60_11390, partial [Bdellovibrionales bacterium]|nr:hypothetical protein [Bdellovibrionales bacterium]